MIGLVDVQLQQWPELQLCPPNLEIMKLATYYKQEKNIYCRLVGLEEEELSAYDKVYVFSESTDFTKLPKPFSRANNIIYGGSAFTNGQYIPFDDPIIDYTLPKVNIYTNFLKEKLIAGIPEKEIERVIDSTYFRWHAGEQELPIPPIQKRKRVYIYDKDFFQEGWRDVINKISAHKPSIITFIHPVHYKKITDFLDARENKYMNKSDDVFLDLGIPLRETPILMKHYKNRLLAVIQPNSHVYLPLGGSYYYNNEYYKDFIYKLKLLYVFWSHGIPIKLKYEKPKMGCFDPLEDLSTLIASWANIRETNATTSILDKIPSTKSLRFKSLAYDQLRFMIQRFPASEFLFRQTSESVKKGGYWLHGCK